MSTIFDDKGIALPKIEDVRGSTTGIHKGVMLDSSAQLVLPPAIAVMIQGPILYKEHDPAMYDAIELMMTQLPNEITGFDVTTTIEAHDGPESRTGQTVSTVGRQTLEAPSLTYEFPGLQRAFIWEATGQWFEDMSALGTGVYGARFPDPGPPDLSRYSCIMAYIQPDPTYLPERILQGNVIAGVFPTERGEYGMQKNNDHNAPTRSVQFKGYSLWTPNLRAYLVEIAKKIRLQDYRNVTQDATNPTSVKDFAGFGDASKIISDTLK